MRMSSAGAVLLQSRKLARTAASSGAHGGVGTGTGSPTRPGSILQQAGARSPGDSPDAVRDDRAFLLLLLSVACTASHPRAGAEASCRACASPPRPCGLPCPARLPSAQQPGLPLIARTRSVHFEPSAVVSPHGRLSPIELPPGVVSPHGRVSPPARAKDKLQGQGGAAPAAGAQRPSTIKV